MYYVISKHKGLYAALTTVNKGVYDDLDIALQNVEEGDYIHHVSPVVTQIAHVERIARLKNVQ